MVSAQTWLVATFLAGETQTWLRADTLGLFAVLFFIFDDLVLFLLLHVTVQVADEELRIGLYVIDGEVKDIFPILSDNTGMY